MALTGRNSFLIETDTASNSRLKEIQLSAKREAENALLYLIPIELSLAIFEVLSRGEEIFTSENLFSTFPFWLIGASVLSYLYFVLARNSNSNSPTLVCLGSQLFAFSAVAFSQSFAMLVPIMVCLTLIVVSLFLNKSVFVGTTLILILVPFLSGLTGNFTEGPSRSLLLEHGTISIGTLIVSILLYSLCERFEKFLTIKNLDFQSTEKLIEENKELKSKVRVLAESIAKKLDQTGSTINQIVSVAGVSLTNDLATSAAQAATAVEETRTVVGQVKETVSLSHDRAQGAVQDSLSIQTTYQAGQKSTEAVIKGMQRIQDCMNSIAESMVQLSNQTLQIGEIIMTVDSIAQQSNLLSVNAAVEAASAGEHGKGFVVVAREVKNLAMQSKKATAKVRVVLNEISAAATKATMDTEQGTKAVVDGQVLAGESSKAIRSLNENVMKTKNALDQIEQFAGEQLLGIEQIANAMNGLKEASDKNLVCSRDFSDALARLVSLNSTLVESAAEIRAISEW